MNLLFDLDNTLINTELARQLRTDRKWSQVYDQISNFNTYGNLIDILQEFKEKHSTYVVTSSPGSYAQKVCATWNIPHQGITAYHDTANHKPHPEPFTYTLERYELTPEECLTFGDDAKDILASKSAGIKSIACLWGTMDSKGLIEAKPDHILDTVEEVRTLLETL